MSKITIYDSNTVEITVDVYYSDGIIADINAYDATLYVKKAQSDANAVMEVTGTCVGNIASFSLSTSDTNIATGNYVYEVLITNGTYTYTVAHDVFVVLDSLATHTT